MDLHSQASPATREESPIQKQARVRRERREAKIKAGGSSRLDKITSLSGRSGESGHHQTSIASLSPDPDEVDISQHRLSDARPLYSSQKLRARDATAAEGDISYLLHGSGLNTKNGISELTSAEFPPGQSQRTAGSDREEDRMMRMLQQMIGATGIPNRERGSVANGGLPSGLAAMLRGGEAGREAGAPPVEQRSNNENAYRWKIVHALLAMALGIYVISVTTFSGVRCSQGGAGTGDVDEVGLKFFWAFVTAELVLQSSRFFLEKGQVSQEGFVGFLMGILPEPWRGWVALASRYSGIYTTIVQDVMVLVFVLGCAAWWKGVVE